MDNPHNNFTGEAKKHIFKNCLPLYCKLTFKVKVKLSLEQATKAQKGSRGIVLLFL
jgi:hypothetical protein